MRQRLFKAISCVALMVSVFFCNVYPAYADELDPSEYDPTYVVGDTVTRQVYVTNTYATRAIGQAYVSNYVILTLPAGYVYSGQLSIYFDLYGEPRSNVSSYVFNTVDHNVTCSSSDVGVAYRYVSGVDYHYRFYIDLTFNGLYAVEDLPITVGISMYAGMAADVNNVDTLSWALGKVHLSGASDYVSRNWTASLPDDYNVGGVVQDSAQQQMQQQQQIADQQAQQSQQQHDDLKNGFTDNTYNDNVSNAGSQVDSYIDLEHNLLEQQNQQMSDYADTAFNLNTLSPYINAIALTSTFFTWIWNGFGEMSVVFVIVLAIGVACLILGIRRRG